MVSEETRKKAKEFLEQGKVEIVSRTGQCIEFLVNGYTVWKDLRSNKEVAWWEWNCNASTQRRKKDPSQGKYGCVMRAAGLHPKCSHELAAELFLKKLEEDKSE